MKFSNKQNDGILWYHEKRSFFFGARGAVQRENLQYFSFGMQQLPYVPTITNYTQVWWVPNVVVAHQKEGIEALHLASGRTICKVNYLST